jgi:hypothetical protein
MSQLLAVQHFSARSKSKSGSKSHLIAAVAEMGKLDPGDGGFQPLERHDNIRPRISSIWSAWVASRCSSCRSAVLLFVGVILASWTSVRKMSRFYYGLLLLLEHDLGFARATGDEWVPAGNQAVIAADLCSTLAVSRLLSVGVCSACGSGNEFRSRRRESGCEFHQGEDPRREMRASGLPGRPQGAYHRSRQRLDFRL